MADGDVGSFLHSSGLIYILTTYCSRPGILLWTAVGKVIDFSVMERLVVNAIVWSIPHDYLTFFLSHFFFLEARWVYGLMLATSHLCSSVVLKGEFPYFFPGN